MWYHFVLFNNGRGEIFMKYYMNIFFEKKFPPAFASSAWRKKEEKVEFFAFVLCQMQDLFTYYECQKITYFWANKKWLLTFLKTKIVHLRTTCQSFESHFFCFLKKYAYIHIMSYTYLKLHFIFWTIRCLFWNRGRPKKNHANYPAMQSISRCAKLYLYIPPST